MRNTEAGIRIVTVDTPSASTGVRVSVASSGICGSDLHLVSFGPLPFTLGHEFCGRLDNGTPVAVLPRVTCGTCVPCRGGNEQQCPTALATAYGISADGGLADEVWVDPACAHVLPPELPLDHACLVEPLAVAVHGVHRAGVPAGGRVLVIGGGSVGLCAVAAALAVGAEVDIRARHSAQSAAAERLGARPSVGSDDSVGSDYDVVLDAAGTQSAIDEAIRRVRPGGTVGILATFWDPVAVGMGFQMKEVSLVPSFMYGHHHSSDEFDDAARLLVDRPNLPEAVISHRFPLEDASEAFRVAADRTTGTIKVVVDP